MLSNYQREIESYIYQIIYKTKFENQSLNPLLKQPLNQKFLVRIKQNNIKKTNSHRIAQTKSLKIPCRYNNNIKPINPTLVQNLQFHSPRHNNKHTYTVGRPTGESLKILRPSPRTQAKPTVKCKLYIQRQRKTKPSKDHKTQRETHLSTQQNQACTANTFACHGPKANGPREKRKKENKLIITNEMILRYDKKARVRQSFGNES